MAAVASQDRNRWALRLGAERARDELERREAGVPLRLRGGPPDAVGLGVRRHEAPVDGVDAAAAPVVRELPVGARLPEVDRPDADLLVAGEVTGRYPGVALVGPVGDRVHVRGVGLVDAQYPSAAAR